MKVLITGAKGFVGKNLAANLYCIKDGKNRTRDLTIEEIFEYDIDTDESLLDTYCEKADFVFNLAGVNRPKEQSEFMDGNLGFASKLLDTLKKYHNTCPVMLSSSIQATLIGRYDSLIMERASWQEKSYFSNMAKSAEQKCWCTVSRTFLENGADRITTVQLLHSAITSQTIFRFR